MKICSSKHAIYEITSSGLTQVLTDEQPLSTIIPYAFMLPRYANLSPRIFEANFGMLEINWEQGTIALVVYKSDGIEIFRQEYGFDEKADSNEWCDIKQEHASLIMTVGGYICLAPAFVLLVKIIDLQFSYFNILNKLF